MQQLYGFKEEKKPCDAKNPTLATLVYQILLEFLQLLKSPYQKKHHQAILIDL